MPVSHAEVRKAYHIPETAPILSVSEINAGVERALRNRPELSEVFVTGEVTDVFRRQGMEHTFFALKDERAKVRCFLPKSVKLSFDISDGGQILVRGSVGLYEPRGDYRIEVQGAFPLGAGMLALQHQKLIEKLRAEGLFSDARKRGLLTIPRCIGIVSSKSGKGFQDALATVQKRFPNMPVAYYNSFVQGQRAPESIATGLKALNQRQEIDVILLVRGGGAAEDLSAYNDERVVRAVVASRVPVVTGIGHDKDETICDMAADVRESTPTSAAKRACPDAHELLSQVGQAREALERAHASFLTGTKKDAALASYQKIVQKQTRAVEQHESTVLRYRIAIIGIAVLLLLALAALLGLFGGGR